MEQREVMQMLQVPISFEPEEKPAVELVRGRLVRKMSPRTTHAIVQKRLMMLFDAWVKDDGVVAPEWRFYFAPHDAAWGSLVPDVAWVSGMRMAALTGEEIERPPFAPDIAIEILSPRDSAKDVAWKVAAYLHAGTRLVVVADPKTRTLLLHDPGRTQTLTASDAFEHAACPGLRFEVDHVFAMPF